MNNHHYDPYAQPDAAHRYYNPQRGQDGQGNYNAQHQQPYQQQGARYQQPFDQQQQQQQDQHQQHYRQQQYPQHPQHHQHQQPHQQHLQRHQSQQQCPEQLNLALRLSQSPTSHLNQYEVKASSWFNQPSSPNNSPQNLMMNNKSNSSGRSSSSVYNRESSTSSSSTTKSDDNRFTAKKCMKKVKVVSRPGRPSVYEGDKVQRNRSAVGRNRQKTREYEITTTNALTILFDLFAKLKEESMLQKAPLMKQIDETLNQNLYNLVSSKKKAIDKRAKQPRQKTNKTKQGIQ